MYVTMLRTKTRTEAMQLNACKSDWLHRTTQTYSCSQLVGCLLTPEKGFQVVWQLRATSIAGVHGDVHSTTGVQLNLSVFKYKALDFGLDGQLDGQNLLCHN